MRLARCMIWRREAEVARALAILREECERAMIRFAVPNCAAIERNSKVEERYG